MLCLYIGRKDDNKCVNLRLEICYFNLKTLTFNPEKMAKSKKRLKVADNLRQYNPGEKSPSIIETLFEIVVAVFGDQIGISRWFVTFLFHIASLSYSLQSTI